MAAQWYEQFLQVGQLNRALIVLDLALRLPSDSVTSFIFILRGAVYIKKNFVLLFTLPVSELSRWDWPLTWLTNHRPSVL